MSEGHIVGTELDFFHGLRQLKISIREESGVRSLFLPVANSTKASELAEDCRAFAQAIAPRRGRPPKRTVKQTKDGGDA